MGRRWLREPLSALPRGEGLDDDRWRRRHRVLTVIAALHVPALLALFLAGDLPLTHALAETAIVAVLAAVGALPAGRRARTLATVAALVSASAVVTHATGGLTESHFHFFIVVGLVSLYRDWVPLGVVVGYVILHHGALGTFAPRAVYEDAAAWQRPWLWAAIHGGAILAVAAVHVVTWRAIEDEVRAHEATAAALRVRRERHRQAAEINDNVVQGLVLAHMALQAGEHETASAAIGSTLASARQILTDLFDGSDELDGLTLVRRTAAHVLDRTAFDPGVLPEQPAT